MIKTIYSKNTQVPLSSDDKLFIYSTTSPKSIHESSKRMMSESTDLFEDQDVSDINILYSNMTL